MQLGINIRIRVANFEPLYLRHFWVKIQSFCAHWTGNFLNLLKASRSIERLITPFFWDNLYILNSCSAEKVSTTQLKSKIRYPIGLLYINNNYHGIIIYLIVNLIFYCIQFIWQYFFFFQDKSNEGMSDSVTVLQDNRKIIPKMSMTYILQISNIFENLCLLLKNFC